MRSFGAAALVTLAILAECFGAKDRSRQRSGSSRRVPVAANIKREADFDCPEEFGYYPHPTDCTLYYVCVFGGALMESCTGGLMYSHELQTCDWPRNVGCDATGTVVGQELERFRERDPPPPPPPPRRTPPSPPQRAQLNPVVTSRGQPKFNRQEYEKQQQLYAEVDDFPPVEELESDRQQRVYRGQPSTLGQVQKDRDGYGTQALSSGRNLNSNIIPASIPQNSGKFGSFSFGTQVDDRRTASVTSAPQTYRADNDYVTNSSKDRDRDIKTNEISSNDGSQKAVGRRKRDLGKTETNITSSDKTSDRTDSDDFTEYVDFGTETKRDSHDDFETDRDKRQIRYLSKSGYRSEKNRQNLKPVQLVDLQQFNHHNLHNPRYQSTFHNDHYIAASRKPYSIDNMFFSTANPFLSYQTEPSQSQKPFKPSVRDPFNQKKLHNNLNTATQIITKSPPISSLNSRENLFSSLSGGFFNNAPKHNTQNNNKFSAHIHSSINRPKMISFLDSSQVPSTAVTNKPIQISYLSHPEYNHKLYNGKITNNQQMTKDEHELKNNQKQGQDHSSKHQDYNDSYEYNESEETSDEEDDQHFKHDFPDPPYAFTHPNNKYAEIENPFAKPDFDFDEFLAKLQNDHYAILEITSPKPKNIHSSSYKNLKIPLEITTTSFKNPDKQSIALNYKGVSTPRPFTLSNTPTSTSSSVQNHLSLSSTTKQFQEFTTKPQLSEQNHKVPLRENHFNRNYKQNIEVLSNILPKLKPPNFTDDRQLSLTHSFSRPIETTRLPSFNVSRYPNDLSVTQKSYIILTSTGRPIIISTQNHKPNFLKYNINSVSSIKPFTVSTIQPTRSYDIAFEQPTPKTVTTVVNDQLSTLQHYWKNPTNTKQTVQKSTVRPSIEPKIPQFEKLHSPDFTSSTELPLKTYSAYSSIPNTSSSTTTNAPLKRKPIPKPSPEMNDYYYDDEDDNYYYEPIVKPKYMPSTEVRPQRPPMAQNYREYEDIYEYSEEDSLNVNQANPASRRPVKYMSHRPKKVTKNQNDVSVVTKVPFKESDKYSKDKVIPVLTGIQNSNTLNRPEVSNYEINHNIPRNRTTHLRKPHFNENGPNTNRPPKYLNQTTLRPYTVRHRLAKPTATKESKIEENKQNRGRGRHPNIVAQMLTTPRDNYNQETRQTKTKHDGKSNSLEPTESVTPSSFSPSPRPKMLYNGSQNYSPDQFDPFYAVYDEDGELYKDTDYVQQYNTASQRPAVQQTYRGTPPPSRRPVETYTPRPALSDDYDDVLIQGQINNQNQYQSPVRHSTRGEGNELGYEHNPSSVRTTVYEATTLSTTPSTTRKTTTTTTTPRPTTALFTEAMTSTRYISRFSADENPGTSTTLNSFNESTSVRSTLPPVINFSSRAKPFRKTENSHRSVDNSALTERLPTHRLTSPVTYKNNDIDVKSNYNKNTLSGSTGFSIRRNLNNTKNPYTLTVITRPDDGDKTSQKVIAYESNAANDGKSKRFNYDTNDKIKESAKTQVVVDSYHDEISSRKPIRRRAKIPPVKDIKNDDNYSIKTKNKNEKNRGRINLTPAEIENTKYYLRNIVRRPVSSSATDGLIVDSTENIVNSNDHINEYKTSNATLLSNNINTNVDTFSAEEIKTKVLEETFRQSSVSPYKSLDNLRKSYTDDSIQDSTSSTSSATFKKDRYSSRNPSYYSYSIDDETVPDHTTEVLSDKVRTVIKAFFKNIASNSRNEEEVYGTTPTIISTTPETIVNIGYQKKFLKYIDEKPLRSNIKYLQIITEPSVSKFIPPNVDAIRFTESLGNDKIGLPLDAISTASYITTTPIVQIDPKTTIKITESSTDNRLYEINNNSYESKFSDILTSTEPVEKSRKYQYIISDSQPVKENSYINISNTDIKNEPTKPTVTYDEEILTTTETEQHQPMPVIADVASTTSTTKSTTTAKLITKMTTKSLSFPTRASRINPAIKLAAANLGSGRRSYQSSTNCSSDNSLQVNPKCNEIKYQRPSSTRGRGSAHYSTSSGSEAPQQQTNRGTPPTRSRPTLKPSTAIVSETRFVDIYSHPPRRPEPVYPQPTPDKTAAKCRKDVCLLPDCFCGGKDIPGNLPVVEVPQMVLITFDDAVNDVNKMYYEELFENGRVNPNGCPITSTFYVSHEWTDYSQVQNLYADGHEFASHTISHSFGEQFSQKKWNREVGGQREILAAYGGVKLEDVRGMRAPFLSVGGNKMFKMLYDSNFTYDSSLPVYENRPPSWPYTLDYKLFHDCMIPPCPTKSYPGVWEVPMVMWQDLNGGRCSMGDACANPPESEGVYKMLVKNFDRHYTSNRAPFGLFYHAAWFTQPHHKAGFIMFLDYINQMKDVWIVTNWQALQWVRDPTPISRLNNFQPFQCNYPDRPKKCNNPKVCNLWHKSGVRYMRTCQPCPEIYPWTGKTGIKSSRIDNDIED